jgi:hypothetical protein
MLENTGDISLALDAHRWAISPCAMQRAWWAIGRSQESANFRHEEPC